MPIGRPIAGTSVHLLDAGCGRCRSGVPGELHVGGDGLARGYRGRPELTAERFVPDPFAAAPGDRLYRTGDLARWDRDGRIEFLGRADQQVKIRGFRVEPGEVEAALVQHPDVARAAVVVREHPGLGRHLVAWVVPRQGEEPPADLKDFLRSRLPEPLLPAFFAALPELPLSPNGKVDRRALAALEPGGEAAAAPGRVAPRTPLEARLAEIWSEVLGGGPVGVHDDFFALGGHSLLAIRVLSRIKDAMGVEVPVAALFQAPTVAGLAELMARGAVRSPGRWTPRLEPSVLAAEELPAGEVREILTGIWRETLGREDVGPDDDFFALGGQSLLALKALARIRDAFGAEVTMADLFEAPTVAGMAQRLRRESAAAGPPEAGGPAVWPGPDGGAEEIEAWLAGVWRDVLGVESVGPDDDFFELGGQSILAHRLAMRIAEESGVALPPQAVFEAPTLAALARRLAAADRGGALEEGPGASAELEGYPLSLSQQRLWFIDRLHPGSNAYNLYVAARFRGGLELTALVRALAAIVARHEPLRTVYTQAGGEPVQVVLPSPSPAGLAFARVDLSGPARGGAGAGPGRGHPRRGGLPVRPRARAGGALPPRRGRGGRAGRGRHLPPHRDRRLVDGHLLP